MDVIDRSEPIGLVGLGNLGGPMARALLGDGWTVTVLDRDPRRTTELAEAGAAVADTPRDLVDCRAVLLVVPDDEAVGELLETATDGTPGLFDGLAPGALVLVHSTVLPATAQRLGELGEKSGVAVLDAPVSGGPERALEGDLTVMVGGSDAALAAARPLLDAIGSTVAHIGRQGAGAATKLANQLMMFSTLAGVHEAVDFAGAYGVTAETLLAATATGTAGSWVSTNWGFFDRVAREYDEGGTPVHHRPWSKDLFEVVEAARAAGVGVPVTALLSQILAPRVEEHARRHQNG